MAQARRAQDGVVYLRRGVAGGRPPLRTNFSLCCNGNTAEPHRLLRFKHAEAFCRLLPLRHGSDLPRLLVAFRGGDGMLLPHGAHPLPPGVLPGRQQGVRGETGQGSSDDHFSGGRVLHQLSALPPHKDHVPGGAHAAYCAL